jgi:hypothetical protein
MEQRAEIRRLHRAKRLSIREIHRRTVRHLAYRVPMKPTPIAEVANGAIMHGCSSMPMTEQGFTL